MWEWNRWKKFKIWY